MEQGSIFELHKTNVRPFISRSEDPYASNSDNDLTTSENPQPDAS